MHWSLPQKGEPGEWMEVAPDPLRICKNGLHLAIGPAVVNWLGQTLYIAQYDDEDDTIDGGVKIVVRRARLLYRIDEWTSSVARAWSIDVALLVLPVFEAACPNDSRPRDAIMAAKTGHSPEVRGYGWEPSHFAHKDRAVEAAARAAGECVYAGEAGYGKNAPRRVAKNVIRAYRAFGLGQSEAQAVLYGLLLRYLSGVVVPTPLKRESTRNQQCPHCHDYFAQVANHRCALGDPTTQLLPAS